MPIFKAFSKREYAEVFLNHGILRMGSLVSYKETEDRNRQDQSESTFRYFDPAGMHHHTHNGNIHFAFCCALATVDLGYLANRFGQYIVEISDPVRFKADVTQKLRQDRVEFFMQPEWVDVEYSRDQAQNKVLSSDETFRRSRHQKAACFKQECETRLILAPRSQALENLPHLAINLSKRLTYAKLFF